MTAINYNIESVLDTAAVFATLNPVLLEGQLGKEVDTGRFKIGDGVSAWAQGGPGGSGGSWGSSGGHGGYGSIGGSYGPSPPYFYDPTPGDAAGRYIDGNSYVTWLANGTRQGLAA